MTWPISLTNTGVYASTWPWPRSAVTAVTWWTRCNDWRCADINNSIATAANWRRRVLSFVLADFPRQVREQWRFVLIASLLFFGSLLSIALLVYLFPDLIYSIVSPQQVAEMQGMYDPDASRLGRAAERASSEDWMMFGYYVMHNIGIAFQTFAAGLLFGLGSVFPDIQRADHRRDFRAPD